MCVVFDLETRHSACPTVGRIFLFVLPPHPHSPFFRLDSNTTLIRGRRAHELFYFYLKPNNTNCFVSYLKATKDESRRQFKRQAPHRLPLLPPSSGACVDHRSFRRKLADNPKILGIVKYSQTPEKETSTAMSVVYAMLFCLMLSLIAMGLLYFGYIK